MTSFTGDPAAFRTAQHVADQGLLIPMQLIRRTVMLNSGLYNTGGLSYLGTDQRLLHHEVRSHLYTSKVDGGKGCSQFQRPLEQVWLVKV